MRYLRAGAERPADRVAYFAQLSRMILFDFIVDDVDRWSGGNIKTSPDRTVVYFMDNSFSFSRNGQGHDRVRTYLRRTSTFSRRLASRLRTLTREDIVEALHDIGPLAPLLGDEQIDAILARRDYALGYIDEQIARRGDDAVLAFP